MRMHIFQALQNLFYSMANEDDQPEANSTVYYLQRCFNHLTLEINIANLTTSSLIPKTIVQEGCITRYKLHGSVDQWRWLHYQFFRDFLAF